MEKRKKAYEQFQESVLTPPDPDQKQAVSEKIIHPEYELRPRIERLFARWMALHTVDYASREARFIAGETETEEEQCPDGILCEVLPALIRSAKVWQWFVPESTLEVRDLQEMLRTRSLPPEDANPFTASLEVLRRLFFSPSVPRSQEPSLLR